MKTRTSCRHCETDSRSDLIVCYGRILRTPWCSSRSRKPVRIPCCINTPECRGNDWLFGNLVSRSFYAICQFVVRKWFNSSASSTRKTDIEKCRQGWNVISFRKMKWKHRKRDSVSFPLVSKRVFPWLQRKITINVIVTNVEDGHKQKHVKFSKERVQIRKRGKVCIVYHNFS